MERANCFCYNMDRLQTGWTGKEGEENHKALEKSAVERQNETLSRVKETSIGSVVPSSHFCLARLNLFSSS